MAGSGGPWGGGSGDDDDERRSRGDNRGGRRPGEGPQLPEIDEMFKKGTEQLRVLMGGRSSRGGSGGGGDQGDGPSFGLNGRSLGIGALVAAGLWAYASFYTVKPEEKSVELLLGKRASVC